MEIRDLPPYTTPVTILVVDEFVPTLIGRPIFCSHFQIDRRADGFYEMTVCGGEGDSFLNRAEVDLRDTPEAEGDRG